MVKTSKIFYNKNNYTVKIVLKIKKKLIKNIKSILLMKYNKNRYKNHIKNNL